MKKFLSIIALGLCFTSSMAYIVKTEKMTIHAKDGNRVAFNIADIDSVAFSVDSTNVYLNLEVNGKTPISLTEPPVVFRSAPAEEGGAYHFGLGTAVNPASPDDIRAGKYGLDIAIDAAYLNTGTLELGNGKENHASVILYEYEDENVISSINEIQQGSLTTALDRKSNKVTLALDVIFIDGSHAVLDFNGKVTDVENLSGLNPPKELKNTLIYYGMDGNEAVRSDIASVSKSVSSWSGKTTFTFNFPDDSSALTTKITVKPEAIGVPVDFASMTSNIVEFTYGHIQVSGPEPYRNRGLKGTLLITSNEDGSFKISADIYNKYECVETGAKGDGNERVVINYSGPVE